MKLKVIDDFLKPEDFKTLQTNKMESSDFLWQIGQGVNTPDDGYHGN